MNLCVRIILIVLFLPLGVFSQKHFQLHVDKTNLVVQRIDSINSWRFLTDLNSQETGQVEANYCYVRLYQNKVWVYRVSANQWLNNAIIDSIPTVLESDLTYYSDLHKAYTSFWIKAESGHIIMHQNSNQFTYNNHTYTLNNEAPVLFLKGNRKIKISEPHTTFVVANKNTIYQIDTAQFLWRSIQANRTFSAWNNTAPNHELLQHYFPGFPNGILSYLGKKENNYLYQIENNNQVGLITVNDSLNQYHTVAPPQFDFISPNIFWNGYVCVQNNTLFYTNENSVQLHPIGELGTEPLRHTPVNSHRTVEVSLLVDGNLLYNDYSTQEKQANCGIYNLQKHVWYMAPTHHKLVAYENAIVEIHPNKSAQNSFSLFSTTGYRYYKNITPEHAHFSELIGAIANVNANLIKDLTFLPSKDSTQVKFRIKKQWHTVFIDQGKVVTATP